MTVNGMIPNAEEITREIDSLGVCDDGLISLSEFKLVIKHFKKLLNVQLDFRERLENILKIKLSPETEFEMKYKFKEYCDSLMKYLHG